MLEQVKSIVTDVLQVHEQAVSWDTNTELLGSIPELDSMAVVAILTGLEDNYGFVVDDDEITAETFATLGSLTEFVEQKVAE